MGSRALFNLPNVFSGAEYSQEVHALESRVAELTVEIEELRASGKRQLEEKLEELRSSLKSQGALEVAIQQIEPNPKQPRQTFSEESITTLARSLEEDGQQQPLILLEQGAEKYLLFDGERRWRAAQKLEWKKLWAVLIPEPQALHRRVLLANLHREDLNALDVAEALIKETAWKGLVGKEEIPRLLNTTLRRLERKKKLSQLTELVFVSLEEQNQVLATWELSEAERHILQVLLSLQLNPASVNKNIFPALKLFDELKEAIRGQGLGVHQAMALQRLSPERLKVSLSQAKKLRESALNQVLAETLSVSQTRQLVAELIAHYSRHHHRVANTKVGKLVANVENLAVNQVSRDALESLRSCLRTKLEEIEAALKNK